MTEFAIREPGAESPRPVAGGSDKPRWQALLLALFTLVLLTVPKLRFIWGGPVYVLDLMLILMLLFPATREQGTVHLRSPLLAVIGVYAFFVVLSETDGMIEYGTWLESAYMIIRYLLALSLAFLVRSFITRPIDLVPVFKGIVLGTLITAGIVILYSLGATRGWVIQWIFRWDFINPGWESLIRHAQIYGAGEAAMRGRSPIGAATMTAGFLAITWPLMLVAWHFLVRHPGWRLVAATAALLAPVALLMTYGRAAWLMVGVNLLLIAGFGLAGARRLFVIAIVGAVLVSSQIGLKSNWFLLGRVTSETEASFETPYKNVGTRERLWSFVEPFSHLANNPSWLVVGVGRTGNRAVTRGIIDSQLFEEGLLATHSGFAMAYYCYGFIAAVCQILIIFLGFRLIRRALRERSRGDPVNRRIWQGLMLSWVSLTLWWLSGHGIVGEPRGAMLQFFMCGLLLAFESLSYAPTGIRLDAPQPARPDSEGHHG